MGNLIAKSYRGKQMKNMKKFLGKLFIAGIFMSYCAQIFPNGSGPGTGGDLHIRFDFSKLKDGSPVGWQGSRGGAWKNFSYDGKTGAAKFTLTGNWQGFTKDIELDPGLYIFRAVAKSNSFSPKLSLDMLPIPGEVNIFSIAIGVSNEFREVVLPFYVDGKDKKKFRAGIVRVYQDPSLHEAIVQVKEMEIIRLGDTVLPDNWASKATSSLWHGLDTMKKISRPDRPGRLIFSDALIGTEMWLMTQGGKVNLSYAGYQDFSNDGKYLHAGFRVPGDIISTDGSIRHRNPSLDRRLSWISKTLWLFPWEEKRLPEGADPSDWIGHTRTTEYVEFLNLETRATHRFNFPSRAGWRIVRYPSESSSRGPRIRGVTHEILVWQSDDRKQVAISDMEGKNFVQFKVKSISKEPEKDVIYPGEKGIDTYPMNSAWGKAGNNWTNSVDKDGTRYFLFEINRNSYLTDENPYQVWALPLSFTDKRGLLMVVPTPGVKQIPWPTSRQWKGDNWWNLAGGSPRSGDNAILTLEDGTLLNMSSLGMHSNFRNTVSVNDPYDKTVRFIGSYPKVDHVSWPHEFRRDRDYAFVWSEVVPTVPFIMIDLEHDTLWTVAAMNIVDSAERAAAASRLEVPGRPGSGRGPANIIYPLANPSPDYTKVVYASSMLTVDRLEYPIGDVYMAVSRYPQPPVNLKVERNALSWEKPQYHAEIKGYNLYRSKESGRGYSKVNGDLITGQRYDISGVGFYVMTSVEHSGLESRMFSNEAQVGTDSRYRRFYEAEEGKINKPMVPFFEPKAASNAYGIAVTDPALLYKEKLENGLKGSVTLKIDVPVGGTAKLMARVRGMSRLECESYTTGWPEGGETGKGSFSVKVDGKPAGRIPVSGYGWKWVPLEAGTMPLTEGRHEVVFETGDTGIALDDILVTNDLEFTPSGKGSAPTMAPSVPSGLKAEGMVVQGEELQTGGYSVKPPYFKLVWNESKAPQGVRYYNVYRSESSKFETGPGTLVGSTTEQVFVDCVLEQGKMYYYRVVAIDNWDNRSAGSPALAVEVK